MAVLSTYVKNSTMGTFRVTLQSGAFLDFLYELGDLTISNLGKKLNELVKIRRRGKRVSEAYGEKLDPQLTFSAWCPNLVGSDAVAPGGEFEALFGLGAYSAEASTSGVGAERPFTCNLRFLIEGSDFGDTADETVSCADCYVVGNFAEALEGNKLSFTAEVLGNVVIANNSNTVTFSSI